VSVRWTPGCSDGCGLLIQAAGTRDAVAVGEAFGVPLVEAVEDALDRIRGVGDGLPPRTVVDLFMSMAHVVQASTGTPG
jgi:hypothetical protein